MTNMLDQAIIDAQTLREAAIKSAEKWTLKSDFWAVSWVSQAFLRKSREFGSETLLKPRKRTNIRASELTFQDGFTNF